MLSYLRNQGTILSLVLAMLLGALLPQANGFSFLIRYLLMGMLFLAFLEIEVSPHAFKWNILWVLLANLAVPACAFLLIAPLSRDLAVTAFITAIAPSAIASTIVTSYLQGRVDFAAATVFVTNIGVALVIPIALPWVLGSGTPITTMDVLTPVLVTMFVPLILARLAHRLPPLWLKPIRACKRLSFPMWIVNLFLASANASAFLQGESNGSWATLGKIALLSLVLCAINFSLGALLGGRTYRQETSQALGQKNNAFSIWVALTFANPLAAMGPSFYIIYHNLFNTWQLYRFKVNQNKTATVHNSSD